MVTYQLHIQSTDIKQKSPHLGNKWSVFKVNIIVSSFKKQENNSISSRLTTADLVQDCDNIVFKIVDTFCLVYCHLVEVQTPRSFRCTRSGDSSRLFCTISQMQSYLHNFIAWNTYAIILLFHISKFQSVWPPPKLL